MVASDPNAAMPEFVSPDDMRTRQGSPELLPQVYEELRALAAARLGGLRPGQTLQPTALVHEAYLKITGGKDPSWENAGQFFAAAALAMRCILIDHIRAKNRLKRGRGRVRVTLGDFPDPDGADSASEEQLMSLDRALCRLEKEHGHRKAEIVNMRFFAGMTIEQIGAALGISGRTVDRDWQFARAWLYDAMGTGNDHGEEP